MTPEKILEMINNNQLIDLKMMLEGEIRAKKEPLNYKFDNIVDFVKVCAKSMLKDRPKMADAWSVNNTVQATDGAMAVILENTTNLTGLIKAPECDMDLRKVFDKDEYTIDLDFNKLTADYKINKASGVKNPNQIRINGKLFDYLKLKTLLKCFDLDKTKCYMVYKTNGATLQLKEYNGCFLVKQGILLGIREVENDDK